MVMPQDDVVALTRDVLLPRWRLEKDRLDKIDDWYRWNHDKPHQPHQSTNEYQELSRRSQTPWLRLVVTQLAQLLYVDGYRHADDPDNADQWRFWQENRMDGRQIAVHRAALAYGLSYMTVLPGLTDQGEAMPVMRGVSPRRMIALYQDPAEDDWPMFALRAEPTKVKRDGMNVRRDVRGEEDGFAIRVYDDTAVYYLLAGGGGDSVKYVEHREHDAGICPVVRFANELDLEGRADGEVEPFIPLAGRIDQTTFDRLVVQRFGAWVVRWIAGMAQPETLEGVDAEKLRLRVESILISDNAETKFGALPATPLDGFIEAAVHDVRTLAAVSQTPLADQLGEMANLSAEALAAARAALAQKSEERKKSFGESHEQALRLGSALMGDEEGARDAAAEVRWRDMEPRSLAQVADALGKIAQMLGVPVEMLWERIPGFTDQDVDRAKSLKDAEPDPDPVTDPDPAPVPPQQ